MSQELPLEILGKVAPILCWAEASEGGSLPDVWLETDRSVDQRVRDWLHRELPTYSRDNVDDISRKGIGDRRLPAEAAEQAGREGREPGHRPWGMSPPEHYDLVDAFDDLSEHYLEWTGNELAIRHGRVEELHELAMRLPVRHLIRHRHAHSVATGSLTTETALDLPEQMSCLHSTSRGVRAVVERGLSDGHLHLWGVTSAEESWADHLMGPVSRLPRGKLDAQEQRLLVLGRCCLWILALGLLHERHRSPEAPPHFDLLEHLDRLYACRDPAEAAWMRRHLVDAIRDDVVQVLNSVPRGGGTLLQVLKSEGKEWILEVLGPPHDLWLRDPRHGKGLSDPRRRTFRHRLRLLERLHFTVQNTLMTLRPPQANRRRAPSDDAGDDTGDQAGGKHRAFLHEAFYRYLVYNTLHWNLGIQGGQIKTTGLREFVDYLSAEQRGLLHYTSYEEHGVVLEKLRRSPCLRNVEGRVQPPRDPEELVPWLLGYADAVEAGHPASFEDFGLVFHFIKAGSLAETQLRSKHFRDLDVRHGRIRRLRNRQAIQLYRLLSTAHPVVPFIVGIDAANLELTTPPEVFAPVFRFLRDFPIETRRQSSARRLLGCYDEIHRLTRSRRLGMTYHVGEDFRHLLSGLRSIDEVMQFLAPQPGDRLGHALALALEPKRWARQIGYQAIVPRLEALDTLVWVYHLLGSGHPLVARLGFRSKIRHLATNVYGQAPPRLKKEENDRAAATRERRESDRELEWPDDLSPQNLYSAWRLRELDPFFVDPDALAEGKLRERRLSTISPGHHRWERIQRRRLEKCRERVPEEAARRLLYRYWYDADVRREGAQLETNDMSTDRRDWLAICREVQERLMERVEDRQMVVEVNPSSNRVVGALSRYEDHPIFRLTLDEGKKLKRKIRATINTDDPGIFNTSLAHEYYLLAEVLTQTWDVPEAQVVEWLEWLRKNGNQYSFTQTLPRPRLHPSNATQSLLDALRDRYYTMMAPILGRRRKPRRSRSQREREWEARDYGDGRSVREPRPRARTDFRR